MGTFQKMKRFIAYSKTMTRFYISLLKRTLFSSKKVTENLKLRLKLKYY